MNERMLINGDWVGANGTWELLDPGNEEKLGDIPFGGQVEAQAALDAASDAFPPGPPREYTSGAPFLKKPPTSSLLGWTIMLGEPRRNQVNPSLKRGANGWVPLCICEPQQRRPEG